MTDPWTPPGEEHDFETYAVVPLPYGEYPGSRQVVRASDRACSEAFEEYVGKPLVRSGLAYAIYYPTKASWGLTNDHDTTCMLTDPAGRTSGSLKGSKR